MIIIDLVYLLTEVFFICLIEVLFALYVSFTYFYVPKVLNIFGKSKKCYVKRWRKRLR